ncbi:MAG: hypothetical protein WKF59_11930 [Chitinophagaceae bacterium]
MIKSVENWLFYCYSSAPLFQFAVYTYKQTMFSLLINILLLKSCGIEMKNTVRHFDRLSVTAKAQVGAGFVMDSPDKC